MTPPASPAGTRRWLPIAAVAILLAVLAAAAGWALAGLITSKHRTAVTAEHVLSADQAEDQACNAFRVASRQWAQAYGEWLPFVSGPSWQWSDPAVKDATARFSASETEIVGRLDALIAPNTPLEVAQAIRGYTGALLEYSAGHGAASGREMDDQENQIDDAADNVAAVCN